MRGHEALLAMRMRGAAPDDIHIDTVPNGLWRDWPEWNARHAHILIEPHENVALLDLRFVVGLLVFVEGELVGRVRDVAKACADAQARRVICFVLEDPRNGPDSVIVEEVPVCKCE